MNPPTLRLSCFAPLLPAQVAWIESLQATPHLFDAGSSIFPQMANTQNVAVVSGWVMRTRLLSDGRRRVLAIYLPGDFIHLNYYENSVGQTNIECVTPVCLANMDPLYHYAAQQTASDPIVKALNSIDRFEHGVMLSTIERLSRQSANDRLLHFLLELRFRLTFVGMSADGTFTCPLTQQDLADALNISFVHVNRILTQLKKERAIKLHKRTFSIDGPDELEKAVDFSFSFPGGKIVEEMRLNARPQSPKHTAGVTRRV